MADETTQDQPAPKGPAGRGALGRAAVARSGDAAEPVTGSTPDDDGTAGQAATRSTRADEAVEGTAEDARGADRDDLAAGAAARPSAASTDDGDASGDVDTSARRPSAAGSSTAPAGAAPDRSASTTAAGMTEPVADEARTSAEVAAAAPSDGDSPSPSDTAPPAAPETAAGAGKTPAAKSDGGPAAPTPRDGRTPSDADVTTEIPSSARSDETTVIEAAPARRPSPRPSPRPSASAAEDAEVSTGRPTGGAESGDRPAGARPPARPGADGPDAPAGDDAPADQIVGQLSGEQPAAPAAVKADPGADAASGRKAGSAGSGAESTGQQTNRPAVAKAAAVGDAASGKEAGPAGSGADQTNRPAVAKAAAVGDAARTGTPGTSQPAAGPGRPTQQDRPRPETPARPAAEAGRSGLPGGALAAGAAAGAVAGAAGARSSADAGRIPPGGEPGHLLDPLLPRAQTPPQPYQPVQDRERPQQLADRPRSGLQRPPAWESTGPIPRYSDAGQYGQQPGYRPLSGQPSQPGQASQPPPQLGGQPGYASGQQQAQPQVQTPGPGQPGGPVPPPGLGGPSGGVPAPRRPSDPVRFRRRILVAVLVAALIGGIAGAGADRLLFGKRTVVSALAGSPVAADPNAPQATVQQVAEAVLPSVVSIEVTSGRESGEGSGVVLTSDGLILTNNHVASVASGGGTMTIRFHDGTSAPGRIVGLDPTSDLAVVKADGRSDLKPATFGRSADLKVGQSVVAIGSPLGLSGTVTSGIVSALNRPVRTGDAQAASTDTVIDAVQTDAAINPGNSGGALVNLAGQVVGINSAIATLGQSQSGSGQTGSIGLGFAIPSDEAQPIAQQLAQGGKASHAQLGVTVQDTATGTGAQLKQITAGGPAAKAGLQAGDVVTKVGDRVVDGADALVAAVRSYRPGQQIDLTVVRGGAPQAVTVSLGSSTES